MDASLASKQQQAKSFQSVPDTYMACCNKELQTLTPIALLWGSYFGKLECY
jgi:hypothetical protein